MPDAMSKPRTPLADALRARLAWRALRAVGPAMAAAVALLACNFASAIAPTPTATLAPSATASPLPPASATPTLLSETATAAPPPTSAVVQVAASQNVNCRKGDSTYFDVDGTFANGASSTVEGVNAARTWVRIPHPSSPGQSCWVWLGAVQVQGDLEILTTLTSPPTPVPGAIGGVVYHDMCAPPGPGDPTPNPESGCEEVSGGGYRANGSLDVGEPGLPGVKVRLATGSCPGSPSTSTTTDIAGEFEFTGLPPGNYCISSSVSENSGVLIPGEWTDPLSGGDVAAKTVSIVASQVKHGIYLGWDYQFAP
jgi:uncharacterized protein YraI